VTKTEKIEETINVTKEDVKVVKKDVVMGDANA